MTAGWLARAACGAAPTDAVVDRPLTLAVGGTAGFTRIEPGASGLQFSNDLPVTFYATNQILLNGSGVAAGDIDGDGWCDLYFAGIHRGGALYRNLGHWKFQDITAQSGLPGADVPGTGAMLVDLDGDRDLDLVVNSVGHGTHVYLNDGRGHFSRLAVLNPGRAGMSMAAGDLDGDGALDLYVANYRTGALMDMPNTRFSFANVNGQRVISRVNGRPVTDADLTNRYRLTAKGGIEENGEPDVLFSNVGGREFRPLSFTDGRFLDEDGKPLKEAPFDWGLSVMIRDLNQDGLPDIYVCNDFDSPERIWLNQGGGTFRAAPRLAFRKGSLFSMGLDVGDLNRDGFDDVMTLDMLPRDHATRMDMAGDRKAPVPGVGQIENRPEYMINALFLNRGDGTYAEVGHLAGVAATDWSWSVVFVDVDLDGFEDVLVTNGNERKARSMDVVERLRQMRAARQMTPAEIFEARKVFPRYDSRSVAFRNHGDATFEDKSQDWGFDANGVAHGMALADLDNDGDLDVVVNRANDAAAVYRNNTAAPRVAVRLKGAAPNTRGVGSRITVRAPGLPVQAQEMIAGGRYLSSDEPLRVFAAGAPTNRLTIEVAWRSGRSTVIQDAQANHLYELTEPASGPNQVAAKSGSLAPMLFEDVSPRLQHRHEDELFDDFAWQPLAQHKLSQLGPGLTWCDLDGDGWDDLVVTSGKGGMLAGFSNDRSGGFKRLTGAPWNTPITQDQTTALPWRNRSGELSLLIGSASYENAPTNAPVAREFRIQQAVVTDSLSGSISSTGPMALADVNGDGTMDVLVGGRVNAGRFPEPATSQLYLGTGDGFRLDAAQAGTLAGVGLVAGVVWSDLDGDGDPDLVLATEWGPLKIFRNDGGRLGAWDWPVQVRGAKVPLSQLRGLWSGVNAGDFDGDGRLDLVVGNWGRNSRYEMNRSRPFEIVYGDLDANGVVEMMEAHYDPVLKRLVPERQLDFLARGLPFLKARYLSNEAFAAANLDEMLGEYAALAKRVSADVFESHLFLNRGDHFDARPLPLEAQMSPVYGVCVFDFDGDGAEDLFLSQNFFSAQPDLPRQDAGRGLLLRGDGRGGMNAVSGQSSGFLIYGEQRGAAVADFDQDGRPDLVVGQNGAETRLFHNTTGRPGLRVRWTGRGGGIGAVVRWGSGNRWGPAREIHAGSGYWSHDSTTTVLASGRQAGQLQVRWPGGKSSTVDVPAGTREIQLDGDGRPPVLR